jgi:hypothetical protein
MKSATSLASLTSNQYVDILILLAHESYHVSEQREQANQVS